MGIIRLGVFGFLALAVIFVLVSIYSRSVQREKLEDVWDEEVKTGDRDAYIEDGLRDYEGSLRKKLIWLVFVIPTVVVAGLVYVTNFW
ncbi:MAG: hypothetical protein V3U96_06580 [Paracoccaceae bacterium]